MADENVSPAEPSRRSPLELPQQSYAEAREFQEQRTREAKMKETAEQFVGAPAVPTIGPQPEAGEEVGEETKPAAPRREAGEEAPEEMTEEERARELAALAAQAAQEQRRTAEQQAAQAETQVRGAEENRMKDAQRLWRFVQGLESLTIIGAIITIASMNLQLFNDMTVRTKLLPKPSVPDKFFTALVDCGLCSAVIPLYCPACLVLLLIAMAFFGIADLANYFGISI